MANRPHVPKFGNWQEEENIPYTVVFDKARQGRSGPTASNADGLPDYYAPPPKPKPKVEEPRPQPPPRRPQDKVKSHDDLSKLRQFNDPPARLENRRPSGRNVGPGLEANRRPGRSDVSYENQNFERLQPQGRSSAREENKGLYDGYGGSGRTPTRPNFRGSDRGDKTPTVPKFGDWDKNPGSDPGYTQIFNQVRDEKNYGGKVSDANSTPPRSMNQSPYQPESSKGCCFPWGRK